MLRLSVAAAALVALASADCPNACSGHGDCGTMDQCICYDGFFGGDCSLRVCPVASAFVDVPRGDLNHDGAVGYASNGLTAAYSKVQWSRYLQYESWPTAVTSDGAAPAVVNGNINPSGSNVVGGWAAQTGEAHFQVECSGKGACDRALGVCKCFDGYTGSACQRTTCPNDCSGHGICRTVGEIAAGALDKTFVESIAGQNTYDGMLSPYDYRLWDADQNAACVCDAGYSGMDCSLRTCPRGDDPLTTSKPTCGGTPCTAEIQSFSVDGQQGNAARAAGTYFLEFTDYTGVTYKTDEFALSTDSTVADWTAKSAANEAAVKAALESLPNDVTGDVSVSVTGGGSEQRDQLRVSVTFTSKSGNIPEMRLGWTGTSNAATRRSFVFQPSSPVKIVPITALPSVGDKIWIKVYPTDQTLFGDAKYWVSASAPITMTFSQASDASDAVAAALNAIPAVRVAYGEGVFRRDGNVVARNPSGGIPAGGGPYDIHIAFPGKLFGANKVEFAFGATAPADADYTEATSLNDVLDGNKEAAICSNRGLCDYASGVCKCFTGHTGAACEVQSALAA